MSKPLTDLAEKVAVLYDIQFEVIAALGFLVFILITVCVKLYQKVKEKDLHHIEKRVEENRQAMKALDLKIQRHDDKLHGYETNVIKLESNMRKNSEQIKILQNDCHESRFETDAKLLEVTAKLDEMVTNMTKMIEVLRDHTNAR